MTRKKPVSRSWVDNVQSGRLDFEVVVKFYPYRTRNRFKREVRLPLVGGSYAPLTPDLVATILHQHDGVMIDHVERIDAELWRENVDRHLQAIDKRTERLETMLRALGDKADRMAEETGD